MTFTMLLETYIKYTNSSPKLTDYFKEISKNEQKKTLMATHILTWPGKFSFPHFNKMCDPTA